MLSFDASNRDLCTVKTRQTNTPLQALVLLNDPQMIEAARGLAQRVASKNLPLEQQLSYLYTATTGALAQTEALAQLQSLYSDMLKQVEEEAIETEQYFSIGASKSSITTDKASFAALALTAHTLLNLDQTITRS